MIFYADDNFVLYIAFYAKNALHFFSRFIWHNSFVAIARVLLIGRLAECHQKLSSPWRSEGRGWKKFLLSKHFVKTIRFTQFGTNQSLDILLPPPPSLRQNETISTFKIRKINEIFSLHPMGFFVAVLISFFFPFNSLHLSLIQTKR